MGLTNKQKIAYYRRKALIKEVILNRLRKSGNVMTGGKAVNRYLPQELKKATLDYDILVKNKGMTPSQAAQLLERRLDKRFGGNYFKVSPGIYPGVQKVISRVTEGEIADYTKPEKVPKYKTDIDGVNVVSLQHLKKKFKEIIANKEYVWRHKKDKETLQRIRLFEKTKGGDLKW